MPFGDFDPFDYDPLNARAPRQRQPWRQPATEEESQGVLGDLKQRSLSGLSYILSSADKPRRAVAGLLSGKPREGLAAIPFSDTLGITDPSQSTSGAELNKKFFGVKDDNSWKSWGLGLANEIALDPLTYASFGTHKALTGAGKVADKAGLLRGMTRAQKLEGFTHSEDALRAAGRAAGKSPSEIAEHIAYLGRQGNRIVPSGVNIPPKAPLAGVANIGLPFTAGRTIGTGRVGQAVARGLDKTGDFLRYKAPGGKTLGSWFDNTAGRAVTEEMQKGMRAYGSPAKEAAGSASRGLMADTIDELQSLIEHGKTQGWQEGDILRALRMHAEEVLPSAALPLSPAIRQATTALGGKLAQHGKDWLQEARALGLPQADLKDDYINYFLRQGSLKGPKTGAQMRGGNLFPTGHGSNIARLEELRDIPGGTEMLNKWGADPNLAGGARAFSDPAVEASLVHDMATQAQAHGLTVDPAMQAKFEAKAKQVSGYLRSVGDEFITNANRTGVPLFDPNIAGALERRAQRHGNVMASGKGFYGTLSDTATQGGPIPLTRLIRGMGKDVRLKTYQAPGGAMVALPELHKAMAKQGAQATEPFMRQVYSTAEAKALAAGATPDDAALSAFKATKRALTKDLRQFGVTEEAAQNILKDYGRWAQPGETEGAIKGIDSFTNAFRNLAYSAWLPSHVRNALGGLVQTATQTGPSQMDWLTHKIRSGTATAAELAAAHPGLPAGLSDEAARKAVIKSAYQHGKVFSGINAETDLVNNLVARATGAGITPPRIGSEAVPRLRDAPRINMQSNLALAKAFMNPVAAAKHPVQHFFGPGKALEMVGVGPGMKNHPWLEYGRQLGSEVENRLRMSQFLDLARQGFDPAEAGRKMLATHFDYGALTPMERQVMRRLVPFYTFASRNLPLQARTLATSPGRILPQLRLAAGGNKDEYLPAHLASGVAIPLGPENEQGQRQYISQLGLPIEEAFERFKIQPGDPMGSLRNIAMSYAGGLNPLLKGPLEQVFNRQFFSGRQLSDLKPQGSVGYLGHMLDPDSQHTGATQFLAQAAANSPATRFLTSLDKFTDPRKSALQKAVNLMTGVRISDVDMDKARAIEQRKMIEGALRSNPAISEYRALYVRPEDQAKLGPSDVDQLQVLARLCAMAQQAAIERRKQAAATR